MYRPIPPVFVQRRRHLQGIVVLFSFKGYVPAILDTSETEIQKLIRLRNPVSKPDQEKIKKKFS